MRHGFNAESESRMNTICLSSTVEFRTTAIRPDHNLVIRSRVRRRAFFFVVFIAALPGMAQTKPPVAPRLSPAAVEIVAQEGAFHRLYAQANLVELKKLMMPDFTSVEQVIWNREQVLDFVQQFHPRCHLSPVKISEPAVAFLSPDIATIVYHTVETATCSGRTLSGDTNISSVWVRRDGRWQVQLHTEYADLPN